MSGAPDTTDSRADEAPTDETPADEQTGRGERIAKRLARAGLCSRREAERWIAEGRVSVDGRVIDSPATLVTEASAIRVDGRELPRAERTRLWRYHKEAGVLTTHRDPKGRPTLFARLPPNLPRVVSVGRLDFNSEGLILLTNDGTLARHLELPATGLVRRYRARVHGHADPQALARLARGVVVEGVRYGPIKAAVERVQGTNAWLTIALSEGKNREVRKICVHLGLQVTRLIRVAYGPFQLGELKPGEVAEVPVRVLREQLGASAAQRLVPPKREHAHRRGSA